MSPTFGRIGGALLVLWAVLAARTSAADNIVCLDLEPHANRYLFDGLIEAADDPNGKYLGVGEHTLEGVKFKIIDQLVQVGGKLADSYPEKIEGIAVAHKFKKLYICTPPATAAARTLPPSGT